MSSQGLFQALFYRGNVPHQQFSLVLGGNTFGKQLHLGLVENLAEFLKLPLIDDKEIGIL